MVDGCVAWPDQRSLVFSSYHLTGRATEVLPQLASAATISTIVYENNIFHFCM